MKKSNSTISETMFGGVIAVVATVYMASGDWDIFDLALSLIFLSAGVLWVISNPDVISNKSGILLLALIFSAASTAFIIALSVNLAIIFESSWLAHVDYNSFNIVSQLSEEMQNTTKEQALKVQAIKVQAITQFSIYLVSFFVWLIIGWCGDVWLRNHSNKSS